MSSKKVTPIRKCVHCGYCCKQSPCLYGAWDEGKTQCTHLNKQNLCSIYQEIIKKPDWKLYPAFGEGCCSPLNYFRHAFIKGHRDKCA